MSAALRRQALEYLGTHNTLTVATAGPGDVWAAAVFYVNDAFVLYWLSDPASRHSRNIAHHPDVAIAIHEDYRDWRVIQGMQMEGTAHEIGPIRAADRAVRLYAAKYPFLGDWRNPPPALAAALEGTRVYRFTPRRVFFIDNTREFGHREEIDPAG
ncbi:MAG TPA: pyridoxamine 5'-phosphate oxidase family protein [bacterium]|nr:pyridoxamine 5'-phosphate oxidase family protein [bacterium]